MAEVFVHFPVLHHQAEQAGVFLVGVDGRRESGTKAPRERCPPTEGEGCSGCVAAVGSELGRPRIQSLPLGQGADEDRMPRLNGRGRTEPGLQVEPVRGFDVLDACIHRRASLRVAAPARPRAVAGVGERRASRACGRRMQGGRRRHGSGHKSAELSRPRRRSYSSGARIHPLVV